MENFTNGMAGVFIQYKKNLKTPAEIRADIIQKTKAIDNPQYVFDKIIAVEKDRKVLKKELVTLMKTLLCKQMAVPICGTHDSAFLYLLQKYNLKMPEDKNENELSVVHLYWTFPDIFYAIVKTLPPNMARLPSNNYKNFKFEHSNLGILGLMPAGGKFGGFVKALIHFAGIQSGFSTKLSMEDHIEILTETSYIFYKSTITSQKKREKWFAKLNISSTDCESWSQTFDQKFPKYADLYKRFDQVA